ncbi:DUF6428 family protein [Roseibium album]|uniref:DUF6428 family protein n=1 Tax=Roseibium album TaxID=311410 RepID=UPI003BAEF841
MTPQMLLETLQTLPADLPLVFQTAEGDVGDGYHVTEFKLAQVNSIDCGGRLRSWREAALQLLDGHGGGHMNVGKFSSILGQSITRVTGLGESPLHVEFAHENRGMRIYEISRPRLHEGQVGVDLNEIRAHCKPALEHAATAETAGCCGSASASSCCA